MYGGTRNFKLYTYRSNCMVRSFKTEDAALKAFAVMTDAYKRQTDVWFERNKQTPKVFLVRGGKRVRLKPMVTRLDTGVETC